MHLRPAHRRDIPAISLLCTQAFATEPLFTARHPYRQQHADDFRRAFSRSLHTHLLSRNTLILVVEAVGQVVGVAVWIADGTTGPWLEMNTGCGILTDLERYFLHLTTPLQPTDRSMSPAVSSELTRAFTALSTLVPARRLHLALLGVHPEWQRRGVGRLMVEEGMRIAAEEGVPVMLEATGSPDRSGLYRKLGWRDVGELVLEQAKHRGPVMRWDPPIVEGMERKEREKGEKGEKREKEVWDLFGAVVV